MSTSARSSSKRSLESDASDSGCLRLRPVVRLQKSKEMEGVKKVQREGSDSSGFGTGDSVDDLSFSSGASVGLDSVEGEVSGHTSEGSAPLSVGGSSHPGATVFIEEKGSNRLSEETGSTSEQLDYSMSPPSTDTRGKETVRVSPVSSSNSTRSRKTKLSSSSQSLAPAESGGPGPATTDDQWEIEGIIDYFKDDFTEMYLVKWKDWSADFNTWEPLGNLLNCDDELLRFFLYRQAGHQKALDSSTYVELPNGKRRRNGPPIPMVPPDPRPLDIRIQEFYEVVGCSPNEKDIGMAFEKWRTKQISPKSRWPMHKVNKFLEDGKKGILSIKEIKELRKEILFLQVEQKGTALVKEIKDWEKKINAITGGRPYITVENSVDMTGPPIHFQFVNDYVAGEGVEIPTDPPMGCGCGKDGATSCYDKRSTCCAMQSGYHFAYTKHRKINVEQGTPIYECNKKCKCGPDCPNRVVQDGKSDHKLSIFRTSNGCGWGVKTLKAIKKGSFVTLYVGEVIKSEEADKRGEQYDKNGCTYLFDLDFNDQETYPYSVDASEFGNVAHFINHSCSPNLGVYAAWSDCLDPNLPKLAMFALRDISKDDQLTFDYNKQLGSGSRSKVKLEKEKEDQEKADSDDEGTENIGKKTICLCGAKNCRKYIYIL